MRKRPSSRRRAVRSRTSRRTCGGGKPRSSKRWRFSSKTCSGSAIYRPTEARELLLKRVEDELGHEIGGLVLKHQAHIQETCQQKTREILTTTIQRYAASHTAETTVSTVDIPNDEMKGRIIGREGRNIRAFEKATGVDVIVDDTPGVVIVTGFDSVRREIAKIALERLIQDGRIHPTRIEEIVKETQEEIERHIRRLGQQAALEANVVGLHEKLLDYLGRLHFRTSYSQNVCGIRWKWRI